MAEGARAKLSELIVQYELELSRIQAEYNQLQQHINSAAELEKNLSARMIEVTDHLAKNELRAVEIEKVLAGTQASSEQLIKDISTKADAKIALVEAKVAETTGIVESAQTNLSTVTRVSGQIEQLLTSSSVAAQTTKALATNSATIESRIEKYDTFYSDYEAKYRETFDLIEGLLPGATSAGLASAFEKQKGTYANGLLLWTVLRITSLLGILVYGIVVYQDLASVFDKIKDNGIYELFLTGFVWLVNKSPILLALILFEEFARRTYNRYFKLQEDYSHKKVVSQAFEGYKKQLQDIGEDAKGNAVLNDLCRNVVNSIAESPIRLINEEKERDRFRLFSSQPQQRKD